MVSSRWDYLLQQTNIDIQTLARLVEGCNLPRGCFAWSMSVCRLVRWFGPTGCNGYQSCVSRPLGGCSWWNNIVWFLDVLSTSIRSRNVLFALFSTNMFTQTDTHTHINLCFIARDTAVFGRCDLRPGWQISQVERYKVGDQEELHGLRADHVTANQPTVRAQLKRKCFCCYILHDKINNI